MKIINWCKENYILLSLILLSFLFRIYKLNFQSPWGDELFTLINSHSNKSLGDIFNALKGDVHPPLYYYIVHFFLEIFGDTAYVARFVSILFGVGGMVVLYYLGKELFNKKVALTAVLLLVVNHFHIYYSQEARMYTMLFFTTTLSFLFLIRFIKTSTLKSALLYSITTVLLVNTHFYSLFALFAQYLILLYFILKPYNTTSTKLFTYTFISGVITGISFIPSIVIFLSTSGIKSFWIKAPERDVFTSMFKEFFGFSEIAIFIAIVGLLYFLFKTFNEDDIKDHKIDPEKDKPVFAFYILFVWLFTLILIPFVLSYVHLPMIVSRYFINILPPIFLIIAAGITYIKNSVIRATLLSLFVLFSFTDLINVRDYYGRVMKTQYREVSDFVKANRKNNEKVLSSFEYYFSYYLKKDENNEVTNSSLNQYVNRLEANQEKPESFWYVDISTIQDPATEHTLMVLDSLYIVDENIALFDSYAKHYQNKATYKPKVDLSKFKPYKERNGDEVNYSFEIVNDKGAFIEVSGWGYFNGQSMQDAKLFIVLINDQQEIIVTPESVNRTDVTSYFKSEFDLAKSGFKKDINKKDLQPGNYKLALYLVDPVSKKEALVISDKVITK
jgi:mannosyltransferase